MFVKVYSYEHIQKWSGSNPAPIRLTRQFVIDFANGFAELFLGLHFSTFASYALSQPPWLQASYLRPVLALRF